MKGEATVHYAVEPDLDPAEFARVLSESGLGATRPVDDPGRLAVMLREAGIVVTARRGGPGGELIGLARGVTDFSWSCYLSEVAVSRAAQGLGVGRGLMDEARRRLGPNVALILASMPDAVGFYRAIGMETLPDCFWFAREF